MVMPTMYLQASPGALQSAQDMHLTRLRQLANAPQHRAFKPPQLTQFWDYLTQLSESAMQVHIHGQQPAPGKQQHWLTKLYEACSASGDLHAQSWYVACLLSQILKALQIHPGSSVLETPDDCTAHSCFE